MTDPNRAPASSELPSAAKLLRSTLIAAGVAAVLLITVVMPAEYGVDPTRVGRLLGLTQMGEIKMSLAREAAAADTAASRPSTVPTSGAAVTTAAETERLQAPSAPVSANAVRPDSSAVADIFVNSHETAVRLAPNEGKEIKLVMRKNAQTAYSWFTDRGVVNYDTHADAPGISYHGYAKGSAKPSDEGVLVAAFDGEHGWFWRNRGREALTVTLRTRGDYQQLKRK